MKYNITIMIIMLGIYMVCNTTHLTLYNSLPYKLYYTIQNTSNSTQLFSIIQSYSTIIAELKTTDKLILCVVKETPQPGQEITAHTIILPSPKSEVHLKTYQTSRGKIRLIPQATNLSSKQSNLISINHHDIWLTKITYHPQAIPEGRQTHIPTVTDFTLTSTDLILTSMPNNIKNTLEENVFEPIQSVTNFKDSTVKISSPKVTNKLEKEKTIDEKVSSQQDSKSLEVEPTKEGSQQAPKEYLPEPATTSPVHLDREQTATENTSDTTTLHKDN